MASIAEWSITLEIAKSITTSIESFFGLKISLNLVIEAKNSGQSNL
jgi:hypothetical protein